MGAPLYKSRSRRYEEPAPPAAHYRPEANFYEASRFLPGSTIHVFHHHRRPPSGCGLNFRRGLRGGRLHLTIPSSGSKGSSVFPSAFARTNFRVAGPNVFGVAQQARGSASSSPSTPLMTQPAYNPIQDSPTMTFCSWPPMILQRGSRRLCWRHPDNSPKHRYNAPPSGLVGPFGPTRLGPQTTIDKRPSVSPLRQQN